MDCKSYNCLFTEDKSGQRTQGPCSCLSDLPYERRREIEMYIRELRHHVFFHRGRTNSLKKLAPLLPEPYQTAAWEIYANGGFIEEKLGVDTP